MKAGGLLASSYKCMVLYIHHHMSSSTLFDLCLQHQSAWKLQNFVFKVQVLSLCKQVVILSVAFFLSARKSDCCKKGKVVLTQFSYVSFLLSACIVKHSGVPLPALDSKQIKNLIWLSRTLANVMGEYFANEIVQSCGKGYETEVTKVG